MLLQAETQEILSDIKGVGKELNTNTFFKSKGRTYAYISTTIVCPFCKENHFIQSCNKFLQQNVSKRIKIVKSMNLCSNCLRKGHVLQDRT